MRSLRNACVIAAAFCPALRAADLRAKIVSDVVHYTDQDGQRRTIDVGRKCTDLWSAPDGSVIAFIGIDQFDPRTPQTGPEIDKSGVYVARRSDHFAPTRLPLKPITVRGIKWSIFRRPSVSPDGRTVYFEIPDSVVSSTLISFSFSSAAVEPLGGTTDYCVVWDGKYSGRLLYQRRYIPEDATRGVEYRCYLRDSAGKETLVAAKCDLEEFAKTWSLRNGGVCTPPPFSREWPQM